MTQTVFFLVSPLNIELFDNWNSWLYSICFYKVILVSQPSCIFDMLTRMDSGRVFLNFFVVNFFHFIYHFCSFFIRVIKLVELIKPNQVNNLSLRFFFIFLWILALSQHSFLYWKKFGLAYQITHNTQITYIVNSTINCLLLPKTFF